MLGSSAKSFLEFITFYYIFDDAWRDSCMADSDHDWAFSFMLDNKISIFGHFVVNAQNTFSSNHKVPCVFINMKSYAVTFQNALQYYVSVGEHPEDIRTWKRRVNVQSNV